MTFRNNRGFGIMTFGNKKKIKMKNRFVMMSFYRLACGKKGSFGIEILRNENPLVLKKTNKNKTKQNKNKKQKQKQNKTKQNKKKQKKKKKTFEQ